MKRLIVSDIFGLTAALEELISLIPGNVELVDPYDGKNMGFTSESEAYNCFCSEVGLNAYTNKLAEKIAISDHQVSLLGFSVGASAIWKFSEKPAASRVSGAVGFYGSQIRHDSHIEPAFPMYLVFPKEEKHFAVSELIDVVEKKQHVELLRSDFLHGFMNPHSSNYHDSAFLYFLRALSRIPSNRCFRSLKELVCAPISEKQLFQ
ncbi:dienelactone hydrolase family protein [Endozoicomonas elysicola]|uniref:dienelactone hydrolase family protein n=1 Tax=Endozoicomonas elysicola TaxID=305900 RepID=UPI000378B5BE|nr:dienelactone hydrolase family protein [Endozoicomonas elysicola]